MSKIWRTADARGQVHVVAQGKPNEVEAPFLIKNLGRGSRHMRPLQPFSGELTHGQIQE